LDCQIYGTEERRAPPMAKTPLKRSVINSKPRIQTAFASYCEMFDLPETRRESGIAAGLQAAKEAKERVESVTEELFRMEG
jgi:hypothetical protein